MKKNIAFTLLLLPLLLTGCFNWDYSNCSRENNCVLQFRMTDADMNVSNALINKIKTLDVLLFDANGYMVEHRTIAVENLDEGNKLALTVEPGNYYVVSWGNISSGNTNIVNGSRYNDYYVETVSTEYGAPLYYGPAEKEMTSSVANITGYTEYFVEVPGNKIAIKEINMVRAHRTVNVYIKGLLNLTNFGGEQPIVELTQLPYKYDLLRDTGNERQDYARRAEMQVAPNGESMSVTSITAPISDFENTMYVNLIRGSDSNVIHSFNLKQWVEDNVPDYLNEFNILFTIDVNANITVSLPNWENIGIKPKNQGL